MGKPTGFKEFGRELPKKIEAQERVKHYDEFIGSYSEQQLNAQSARCMNCGIPFCHSGCPLGNVIPEFNDAVYNGEWEEAYRILSSTNNFPEFTGRICPAPCESACVLGINRPAVAIEEIEKHIIEIAFSKGFVKPNKSFIKTGKRVAIVGSGPAGLAAAAQLNKAGHDVTVYERDDHPGGLLRYGIPDFKLDKKIVERRISLMKESGVIFACNTEIGKDIEAKELVKEYDAVLLAGGSMVPREMPIPGRNLKGIHHAMDFLRQSNKKISGIAFDDEEILATRKDVIIIGAGDTGSDCIGTANRQAAKSIVQFDRNIMAPLERPVYQPWPEVPKLSKLSSSQEEGVERRFTIVAKEFVGDDLGQVTGVKVIDLEWDLEPSGRPIKYKVLGGSERILPAQLVLLALGFANPIYEGMLAQLDVALDSRKNVSATEKDYKTSVDKVFAAGDMRRGQSLVVWAISEGREAAREIDKYLMGYSKLESKDGVDVFADVF